MSILYGQLSKLTKTDLASSPVKKEILAKAKIILAINDLLFAMHNHIEDKQLKTTLLTYRDNYENYIIRNISPGFYYWDERIYIGVLEGFEGLEVHIRHHNASNSGFE